MKDKIIKLKNIEIGNKLPFVLIAGPCQLEGLNHSQQIAQELSKICKKLEIPLIFKGSFDKANRTSHRGKRGVGIEKGLSILKNISDEFGCPVITDVHETSQCKTVAEVADIIQIPAFLCRQTDLLVAAAKTSRIIHIKKGQFLAPEDMKYVADKVINAGNNKILLCERGSSFGYKTLVNDFRSIPIMRETGFPVVFDATHSVQLPGGESGASGGESKYVPILSQAACAVGIAALFLEVHPDPLNAPSDGQNMISLPKLSKLLFKIKQIDNLIKQ